MPTAGKVLVILIILATIGFLWLSFAVLETRHQWDAKVKAKAAEVAKVHQEIVVLKGGTEEFATNYKALVDEVLASGSEAARQELAKRIAEGHSVKTAFQLAMDLYIEKEKIDAYQQAVREINEMTKTPVIEEATWNAAVDKYKAADADLNLARANLDKAYAAYFGQAVTAGGAPSVRDMLSAASPKGFLGLDQMTDFPAHLRQLVSSQAANYRAQLSEGQKNGTFMKDKVQATVAEANTWRNTMEGAQREQEERTNEETDLTQQKAREETALANAKAARDKAQQEYDQLLAAWQKAEVETRWYADQIKLAEIRYDQQRGLKTAVVSDTGLVPQGVVQRIDPQDGTIRISIGTRVGVKTGSQLHVYRYGSDPRYLGLLEVVKSDSDGADARMLPEYRQAAIQTEDLVSPEIRPPDPEQDAKQ